MYDIITVGSATMDAFAMTEMAETIHIKNPIEEEIFISYPAGSKIVINELNFFTGGGGTNTAVAYTRLGFKTAYLGNLGKDENGDLIKKILKKEKIAFIGTTTKEKTGYSVVLDSKETDRTILVYKGSNDNLKFNNIKKNKLKTKLDETGKNHLLTTIVEHMAVLEKHNNLKQNGFTLQV